MSRSAIAPNEPDADLYVTKAHALYIDGVLVPAGSLINGTTVTLYEADEFDVLEYFHIKVETHDVIRAQGVAVETLLQVDDNAVNFAEYLRMYGASGADDVPCAPYCLLGARAEVKSRLRSAISPWRDCRNAADLIRERIEDRGQALFEQEARVS